MIASARPDNRMSAHCGERSPSSFLRWHLDEELSPDSPCERRLAMSASGTKRTSGGGASMSASAGAVMEMRQVQTMAGQRGLEIAPVEIRAAENIAPAV